MRLGRPLVILPTASTRSPNARAGPKRPSPTTPWSWPGPRSCGWGRGAAQVTTPTLAGPEDKKLPRNALADVQNQLKLMWDQWNGVFRKKLSQAERTLVSELRDARNKWAHQEA